MDAFLVSQMLVTQGAKKHEMALVLESLHNGGLLPVWGEGKTSAELKPSDIVSIVLGSTAAQPETAAAHCTEVASLIRSDGMSLGEVLTKIMTEAPCDIKVDEITVSVDSQVATIRYPGGKVEGYNTGHGLKAFRTATVIRGVLLQNIALKMILPTTSGWVGDEKAE